MMNKMNKTNEKNEKDEKWEMKKMMMNAVALKWNEKKNTRRWCVNVIYQIISLQSRVLNQHHQK
jgi:hypothetical protein